MAQLFRALARLAHALHGDRVRLQVGGRAVAGIAARDAFHALEEIGHALDVVAGAVQRLHSDAIGLGFAGARVVQLALHGERLAADHRGLDRIVPAAAAAVLGAAAGIRREDHAQRGEHDRDLVLLRAFDRAQHVALGDVRDFVREHTGEFVLVARGEHGAGVHADIAAEGGEGIDLPVAHHEEGEGLLGTIRGRGEAMAHARQPGVEQRVLEH